MQGPPFAPRALSARGRLSVNTSRAETDPDPLDLLAELLRDRIAALPAPPPRLLSVAEVAAALSVSKRTAWRLIADGELRSVRVGNRRLVTEAAIREFVEGLDR